MEINTKYFGRLELPEQDVLCFPKGVFGFEDYHTYLIIPFDDDETSFLCLQSVEDEGLAFILFNPFFLDASYAPRLGAEDLRDLDIGDATPVTFLVITVLYDDFRDSTVNMRCPVVINRDTKTAKQVILEGDYSLRYRIAEGREER